MSYYEELAVAFDQSQEEALIDALKATYGKVDIYNEPKKMTGYHHGTPPSCHLVISKRVNGHMADIGFRRTTTGGYELHIDGDERTRIDKEMKSVKQDYSTGVVTHTLKKRGYTVKRTKAKDGKVVLKATRWKRG